MADCEELLQKARRAPSGLRFEELCTLAECHGWTLARQRASHRTYKRTGVMQVMVFQMGDDGKAKAYQVRQLLKAIEEASAQESTEQ